MRKVQLIVCAFVVVVCSLIGGPGAFAGGYRPIDDSYSLYLPAGSPGGCPSFDVSAVGIGKGRVVVTNESDTTKEITLHVPGKWHQSTDQNGNIVTVATGRNLLPDPTFGLVLVIGNWSWVYDADVNLIQPLTGTGQIKNVCDMID